MISKYVLKIFSAQALTKILVMKIIKQELILSIEDWRIKGSKTKKYLFCEIQRDIMQIDQIKGVD